MSCLPRLLCIALLCLFCGCKDGDPAGETTVENKKAENKNDSAKKMVIAVIPKGTIHEFWKTVHAGAEKAGRELGVEVIWKGPLREDDRNAQISVVEDFIARGVNGIVLAPLDETALRLPVANAQRSGIPVVVFDSGLKGDEYVSYVATNNYEGGKIAGRHMISLLNGKGRVVVLRYSEGSESSTQRENGFLDALKDAPEIEVVSSNQYAGVTAESAYQASEGLLNRFRSEGGEPGFDGFFTATEPTAFAMLRALEGSGLAGRVKFIAFDSSDRLVKALNEDHIHALILQNPLNIGYLGVATLVKHLQGEPVDKRIDTGIQLVTRENMSEPNIQELLNPNIDQ